MKSAWIVIWRLPVAGTTGVETWSTSGRAGTAGSSQPVPEIGSSGVSSWSVSPGHTSHAEVAVNRFGSKPGFGAALVPGSSTFTRYIPGHGPCGIGQLNVSVDGNSASYVPSGLVQTVVIRRQLSGVNGAFTLGTVSTRA